MKTFEDSKGRTWEINLSLGAAQRIEACDFTDLTDKEISILNMHEKDCLDTLVKDAAVIFACIWCCVKPQADKLELTQEEFAEAMDGTAVNDGREAWAGELGNFFPELKTALSKLIKAQKRGIEKASKRMDKISDKMVQRVEKDLEIALDKAEKEVTSGPTFG